MAKVVQDVLMDVVILDGVHIRSSNVIATMTIGLHVPNGDADYC